MKQTSILILLSISFFLMATGCGFNINSRIGPLLDPAFLDEKLETEPIDLSAEGRCTTKTLSLNPVNVETRTDKYLVYHVAGAKHYFKPKEFIDKAVAYMEAKMVQSNLVVDGQKGEKILVALAEASSNGNWSLETNIKLKVDIPAINYSQVYSGVEGSGYQHYASAYALHKAVMELLNDPVFIKYVQCR